MRIWKNTAEEEKLCYFGTQCEVQDSGYCEEGNLMGLREDKVC